MPNLKTDEMVWDEKSVFDFNELISPYSEGGTKEQPVERSIGTIFDYLINKKRYPLDVAGAALLITFNELHNGKVFEGDSTYGSPGRQLVTYIRMKCDQINQLQLKRQVFENIAGARMDVLEELSFEMTRSMIPWFIRIIAPGSWKWLRNRRLKKAKAKKDEPA